MVKVYREFNEKRYTKKKRVYNTENKAKKEAEKIRKQNYNVIVDKDSNGWFLWLRNKTKPRKPEHVIHTR